jgi:hypothetical protein
VDEAGERRSASCSVTAFTAFTAAGITAASSAQLSVR